MKFRMQVLVNGAWSFVRPAGGEPYEYDTEDEAQKMLRICYPDQLREDRLAGTPGAQVRVLALPAGEAS